MAKADLKWGKRSLQLIFWNPFDPEDREHIGFGVYRWPSGDTLAECRKAGWRNFGFRAITVGMFEARYWPATTQT